MDSNKKIYFASDLHLGLPSFEESLKREKLFVKWLDEIKTNAKEIYLVGDIFDFWFEYKKVVPRGFTRFLGKIAEITDSGITVHYFTGNHDLWIFDYLPKEIGVIVHHEPYKFEAYSKKFYVAHGDGLGPYDKGFKRLKMIFTSRPLQWLFARLHPNGAIGFGQAWSHHNRTHEKSDTYQFKGEDKEWLILYAKDILKSEHYDYFIFGHRHIPMNIKLSDNSTFINLGDWVMNFTFAEFDGENIFLRKYQNIISK
ncbi:MAG: UDP-2,3-diacylglucosamine hydrolase [Bacteroidetes bacterium GWA2_31_9]|nr:MAG: UDP-2,3-diacylglucosamine hydrolase [Bacteroidetes bacterium GWA2_31_9]